MNSSDCPHLKVPIHIIDVVDAHPLFCGAINYSSDLRITPVIMFQIGKGARHG